MARRGSAGSPTDLRGLSGKGQTTVAAAAGYCDLSPNRPIRGPRSIDPRALKARMGRRRKASLSRAKMSNPRLLTLGKATGGPAPVVGQEIWSAIRRLKREAGRAIPVIDKSLHELAGVLAGVADSASILEKGRTVREGTFSALTSETTERNLGV